MNLRPVREPVNSYRAGSGEAVRTSTGHRADRRPEQGDFFACPGFPGPRAFSPALRRCHETTFPRAGRTGVVTPSVATVRPTVTGLYPLVSRDVTSDRGDTTPANHAERVPT